MTQASTNRRREDLGQPGPAMRALPNNRWRLFVETYLWETFNNPNKNNHGAQAAAARKAGFGGPRTKPITLAQIGWKLLKDDRMIAAIAEESRKLLTGRRTSSRQGGARWHSQPQPSLARKVRVDGARSQRPAGEQAIGRGHAPDPRSRSGIA